jgi:hypothetical protein
LPFDDPLEAIDFVATFCPRLPFCPQPPSPDLAEDTLAQQLDSSPSARSRKNYSGQSPITRASGKKSVVLARYATNRRLGSALHLQAYSALGASPGARAYYDALRGRNIGHHAALRQLANRLVGILHGCLKTGALYKEDTAWPHLGAGSERIAA